MRLRWMETSEAHSIPLRKLKEEIVEPKNKRTEQPEGSFTSVQMVHTHASLPRGFFRNSQAVKGYYPFPEAEMASKYREESSAELFLKLTRPRQKMPPCDGLDPTMCV